MANLIVSAVAEWNGKALKKGEKDISGFDKGVQKLGKTLAGVFAAQKIYSFGKESLKAFSDDQAAAVKLANAVDNLGLSYSNPDIANFISRLEGQTAVLDDKLRPAFQALLTTTGDVTKSQDLLTNAIDISRGSGVELTTVAQDLANGYVGITKGLKKYNLGLTQAQLKGKSFEELMVLLNKQFDGASAAYLSTYAGKMEVLTTASANAKETIGKGLVDALTVLAGSKDDVQGVADAMNNLATYTADATVGAAALVKQLGQIPGLTGIGQFLKGAFLALPPLQALSALSNKGKQVRTPGYGQGTGTVADYQRTQKDVQAAKAKAAADAKALAIQKSLTKATAATLKAQKQSAMTEKQKLLFNQTAISAVAALKNKLSDEERNKVELMLALEMDNVDAAAVLSQKVAKAYDETGLLAEYMRTLPDANNPFGSWNTYLDTLKTDSIDAANAVAKAWRDAYNAQSIAKIDQIAQSPVLPQGFASMTVDQQVSVIDSATADALAAAAAAQSIIDSINASGLITNVGDAPAGSGSWNGFSAGANGGGGFSSSPTNNYNITVNNPVGNGITDMVQQAVMDAQRLGHNLVPAGSL